jgi:hypothetical protein
VDVFSLTGVGTQFPASVLPAPGSDYAVINLQAVGVRAICISGSPCSSYGAQFAITTFGQRSHPDVPAEFDVYVDINNDGTPDLDIFNADIGMQTTGTFTGQNGVFIADLAAGVASGPYFYTIADLDSANAILTVPLSALTTQSGLQLLISTSFNFQVLAFDNYFTGNLTDSTAMMQYELDMPQVFAASSEFTVAPNTPTVLSIIPSSPYTGASPSQIGLLFMYTDGKVGQEASLVTVHP